MLNKNFLQQKLPHAFFNESGAKKETVSRSVHCRETSDEVGDQGLWFFRTDFLTWNKKVLFVESCFFGMKVPTIRLLLAIKAINLRKQLSQILRSRWSRSVSSKNGAVQGLDPCLCARKEMQQGGKAQAASNPAAGAADWQFCPALTRRPWAFP